jgi:peptidoglycan/xylan/chitin deacetylase (PgdA/CDA1 family)
VHAVSAPVLLIVSLDTEEDNWQPARAGITVENVRELPRLHQLFERLGVRATYFTSYQVAIQPWAAAILRQIHAGGNAEIAAHLHPWNTPPMDEPFVPRNTMTANLNPALQRAKIERLTSTLAELSGERPRAFRAGRWGLGPETAAAVIATGYEIDSSVTPFVSWAEFDDGPAHDGAPLQSYRLDGQGDPRAPVAGGPLLEVPVSWAFNRRPWSFWGRVHRMMGARPMRPLRLAGIASRLNVLRKIPLSPELSSVDDMIALSRCLLEGGLQHLHMFWHTPSLRPGLSPFVRTSADVERLYATVEEYVARLSRFATIQFATISEAAHRLAVAA